MIPSITNPVVDMYQSPFQSRISAFAKDAYSILVENRDVLNQHHETLIHHFGGIDAVLYLCLSNPNCQDFMDETQFKSLKQMIQSIEIISSESSDYKPNRYQPPNSKKKKKKNKHKNKNQNRKQLARQSAINIKYNSNSNLDIVNDRYDPFLQENENVTLNNLIEFYRHSMTIIADPYDDVYSKCFDSSFHNIRYFLHKILFSRRFALCIVAIETTWYILAQIYWFFVKNALMLIELP